MLKNIDKETMFTLVYRIKKIDTNFIHLFVLNSILSMLETSQPDLHCCLHFPNFLSHLSLHCLLSAGGPEQSLSHLSLLFLHLFLQLLADTVVIITRPTTSRTIRNLVYNNMEVKQILSVGGAVHSDKSHVFILTFMFMLLSWKRKKKTNFKSIISFYWRKI